MGNTRAIAMLTAVLLAFGSAPASADVVSPFSLQGLFIYTQSSPLQTPELFSATLLIDTTTGTVEGFQSSLFNNPMFVAQGAVPGSNTYFWSASFDYVPDIVNLVFATTSLIGYTGGPLVSVGHPDSAGDYTSISQVHVPEQVLVSGSVTPLPVPEPSSLAVLTSSALSLIILQVFGSRLIRCYRRHSVAQFYTVKAVAV